MTSSSANTNDRIRLKVLLPIALLAVLILIALVFRHSHSQPPAPVADGTANAAVRSNLPPETSPTRTSIPHALRPVQPEPQSETARLTSIMLDTSASLQARRDAARSLGKISTDEARGLLKGVPPFLKAAVAEGLGQNPSPEARDLLHELANGKDEAIARSAARGLGARDDADAVDTLGNLLFNDKTPLSVRTEAALALGDVNLPSAQDQLTRAISQIHDEDIIESVLDGLGRRPFSDTEEFFRNYLNSPDASPESKVIAIEAVRDADGDVVPFLSKYLNDANPEVRAAAKAALDFLDPNTATEPTNTLK